MEHHGRYANNHSEMRLSAAMAGLGIGVFPEFVARQALASGELVHVLPDWTLYTRYHGVVTLQYSQNKYMPSRLRVFIDYLVNHLCESAIKPS
jgi:DNA-binding transcriptional LysR family regulator